MKIRLEHGLAYVKAALTFRGRSGRTTAYAPAPAAKQVIATPTREEYVLRSIEEA